MKFGIAFSDAIAIKQGRMFGRYSYDMNQGAAGPMNVSHGAARYIMATGGAPQFNFFPHGNSIYAGAYVGLALMDKIAFSESLMSYNAINGGLTPPGPPKPPGLLLFICDKSICNGPDICGP